LGQGCPGCPGPSFLGLERYCRCPAFALAMTGHDRDLALSAIARGTELRVGRGSLVVVGVEYLWGSHGRVGAKGDLLSYPVPR
jgi:hypothetical protein